ncbi:MAG: hypothetical protein ACP5HU_12270 [Phycisphaerae bacterium]
MPGVTTKILLIVLIAAMAVLSVTDMAVAQRQREPEIDEAPKAEGAPWGAIAISLGFAAVIAYLGFMNSKRTHLD